MIEQYLTELHKGCSGDIEFRLVPGTGIQARVKKLFYKNITEQAINTLTSENTIGYNVYVGIATRGIDKQPQEVQSVWIDIDFKDLAQGLLPVDAQMKLRLANAPYPPTMVVESGHGLHGYWLLDTPVQSEKFEDIEMINRKIAILLGGDRGVVDITRVLRVPGFDNVKDPEHPVPCRLTQCTGVRYGLQDLQEWLQFVDVPVLAPRIQRIIDTGEHPFKSRSECDWVVVKELLEAGYTTDEIKDIYETKPIGSKFQEKGTTGESYLDRIIKKHGG